MQYEKVNDSNPGIICGTGTEEDTTLAICHIKSIEDLVAISSLVDNGNSFSGKTIELNYNLDFNNANSYASKQVNQTLITGEGFTPIGNNSKYFSGTFDGKNKIIKGLYINKSTTNYVGLFGYTKDAIIKNINVIDSTVKGNTYVGGITGYKMNGSILNSKLNNINVKGSGNNVGGIVGINTYGAVSNIEVSGKVKGATYVGLGLGYNNEGSVDLTNLIVKGDVEGTSYVAGLLGYLSCRTGNVTKVSGAYIEGSVIGTSNAFTTMGTVSPYATIKTIASSDVTVNGSAVASTSINGKDGLKIDKKYFNDINTYELALDTYIGGDNNNDGYYVDYLSNGNIGIKNVEENPLEFDLENKNGIYLIKNYDDLMKASLHPSYSYKLENNIDVKDNRYYMLGSDNNNFTGTFDGNGKTISNIKFETVNPSIFGKTTSATISNLKLNNIEINGNDYSGIISNYSTDTAVNGIEVKKSKIEGNNYVGLFGYIKDVTIKNINVIDSTVKGNTYVGGITGYKMNGSILNSKLNNINVEGSGNNVGGIVGINTYGAVSNIEVSGKVKGATYVGLGLGYNNEGSVDLTNLIVKGDVEGTSYVAGLLGYLSCRTGNVTNVSGAYIEGSVIGTSNAFTTMGTVSPYATIKTIASSDIIVNGSKVTSTTLNTKNGKSLIDMGIASQSEYEAIGFEFASTDTNEAYWYFNDDDVISLIVK